MKVILDEKLVDELADAAHQFRLEAHELEAVDVRSSKQAQHYRCAERRLRFAINAVRGQSGDDSWAS